MLITKVKKYTYWNPFEFPTGIPLKSVVLEHPIWKYCVAYSSDGGYARGGNVETLSALKAH